MKQHPRSGRPFDTKGKYVRISAKAYDLIKKRAEKEERTFIATLDRLLKA